MLRRLNQILDTDYVLRLETPINRSSPLSLLQPLLDMCIDRQFDFGTAYAYLRQRWDLLHDRDKDNTVIQAAREKLLFMSFGPQTKAERFDRLQKFLDFVPEKWDNAVRRTAINDKNQIVRPAIPPRRVWDLYSNRVVPYWTADGSDYRKQQPRIFRKRTLDLLLSPVSHAWMPSHSRHFVRTPINGYEWSVPIPIDTTLERVRIELLNYGLEYVWLDVLCLRQAGVPEKEDLRLEEWKLDVPTIGGVYRFSKATMCYFSGLGRPFEAENLDGEYHWFNRAWTLQESSGALVTVGQIESSPRRQESYSTPSSLRFYNKLDGLKDISTSRYGTFDGNVKSLLVEMLRRSAHSDLDKISGLSYILNCQVLPGFIAGAEQRIGLESVS